jgi:hypothetical protein
MGMASLGNAQDALGVKSHHNTAYYTRSTCTVDTGYTSNNKYAMWYDCPVWQCNRVVANKQDQQPALRGQLQKPDFRSFYFP